MIISFGGYGHEWMWLGVEWRMLVFVQASMNNELNVASISTKMQNNAEKEKYLNFLLYPNYD